MRTKWCLAFGLSLLLVGCVVPSVGPDPVVIVDREVQMIYPTVQVKVRENFFGTGVVIGWDGVTARVLTAAHLFREPPREAVEEIRVFVLEPAPFNFQAHHVWSAPNADLALLEGTPPQGVMLYIAHTWPGDVQRFDPVVFVAAWPGESGLISSTGWVAQLHPRPLASVIGWFGASGGPVYVWRDGRWVVWSLLSRLPFTRQGQWGGLVSGLIQVTPLSWVEIPGVNR